MSQTGKGKAIFLRGESRADRKRQEEQSDRQKEMQELQMEEVRHAKERQ